jgi:phospholipid transport system substrate-binding protein
MQNFPLRERKRSPVRGLACALIQIVVLVSSIAQSGAMPEASAKIRIFYETLLSTMKEGATVGPMQRYQKLEPVIGQTFDLPFMAQAVVGRSWVSASQAQQRALIEAFAHYVTATYADRFSSYSGQQLRVLSEQQHAGSIIVDSEIVKADGKSVAIKYLMHQSDGEWRIADVYLDGTISELATRRSEFSSIVRQQGIGGLAVVLDQKAESLTGKPLQK